MSLSGSAARKDSVTDKILLPLWEHLEVEGFSHCWKYWIDKWSWHNTLTQRRWWGKKVSSSCEWRGLHPPTLLKPFCVNNSMFWDQSSSCLIRGFNLAAVISRLILSARQVLTTNPVPSVWLKYKQARQNRHIEVCGTKCMIIFQARRNRSLSDQQVPRWSNLVWCVEAAKVILFQNIKGLMGPLMV